MRFFVGDTITKVSSRPIRFFFWCDYAGRRSSLALQKGGGFMGRHRVAKYSGFTAVLLLLLASPVSALGVYVDRLDDEYNGCSLESCSLREAIQVVNNNSNYDTIYLPAGTITLSRIGAGEDGNSTGDLDIKRSVTIVGKGPGVSIVDANFLDRVFHIMDSGVAVLFQRMTITHGGNPSMGDGGGGVLVSHGTAVFLHCDIVDNVSPGGYGGGIQSWYGATVWIEESSVRSNSADSRGGGIFSINNTSLFILRSTVSQNYAGLGGAAVSHTAANVAQITDSTISANLSQRLGEGAIRGGDITLEFCTLTGNTGPAITVSSGSTITLGRTIIHGWCDGSGDNFASLGGNIETPGDTCDLSPANDLIMTADPDLGPLGRFGGPTEVHRPSPASLVVDPNFPPGVPDCTRPDQRRFPRPADGNGGGTPRCDVGAVELIYNEIFLDGFECGYTGSWSSEAP